MNAVRLVMFRVRQGYWCPHVHLVFLSDRRWRCWDCDAEFEDGP